MKYCHITQDTMDSSDTKLPAALLHVLCSKLTGLNGDDLTPHFQTALRTVGSNISIATQSDEFEVSEKIKRKLVRQNREKDAVTFSELHRKLQAQSVLKDRWRILYLLFRLGEENSVVQSSQSLAAFHSKTLGHSSGSRQTSVPLTSIVHSRPPHPGGNAPDTRSSGLGSISASQCSVDSQFHMPNAMQTPYALRGNLQPAADRSMPSLGLKLVRAVEQSSFDSDSFRRDGGISARTSSTTIQNLSSSSSARFLASAGGKQNESTSYELSENLVLREIVFIFQGIEGKYIKYDAGVDAFKINSRTGIPKGIRKLVGRLAECGVLYNKVRRYCDTRGTDRSFGQVGQSFCAALHQELTEYYRLIAVLEAQIQQEDDPDISIGSSSLTLRRLAVWMCEPMIRLKTLAALVDICQAKKGGSLASAVHSYIQHGDPAISRLVRHTLTVVVQPIFNTIILWIYDGELDDVHHEFFVASDPLVKNDRLWHDKYSLRKSMIPSFLTMDLAKKILLTGKTIKFLRQVCQDRTIVRDRDVVKATATNEVESIFSQDQDGVFQRMIDTVYKETSMHLLEVLHTKYKFMDHLKAMRRYLLLGQGDFIRHLMDLLEEDLAKPAQTLFLHNLTGILETAIRATNAQYDDADILKRLDVRLLELSQGDTGWDVFSLEYHISGHIRTVFTTESMRIYLRIFNFLWRAKRMEYVLAMCWKDQISNAKSLRFLPEISPMLHQCHVIVSEMLHFVQQIQYYINFEVLECCWDELLRTVKDAEDLDQIIAAHQEFLDAITTRSLLDPQSSVVFAQLRSIFDRIIFFQTIQEKMYAAIATEVHERQAFTNAKAASEQAGTWGLTDDDEMAENERRIAFYDTVVMPTKSQLTILSTSYQDMIQQFLVMLTRHTDASLRFLSFRLDFNEHYNAKEWKRKSTGSSQKTRQR